MKTKKADSRYDTIRAWSRMMGSYGYYVEQQIEKAKADKAPADAIYEQGGYTVDGKERKGDWARLKDVTSPSTQWYFKQNHPELVAQFTDWFRKPA